MMSKCGWEMAMCVRFLFVQPGVVSTCNVTDRITFVNRFAAVFRKGDLEFVWIFSVEVFLSHVSQGMWVVLAGFWTEFGVGFLHFDCIIDFSHQRQTLDTSFGGALRFGGCTFPRAPHVSTDFESQADQDTSRAHIQQP